MPTPTDLAPPRTTTQVEMSDAALGLVAVIDKIDHSDGSCIPVEVKKGRGPSDGTAWPADRIQVLTHAVLLKRAGYVVTEAHVSYLTTHVRAVIQVDSQAEAEVLSVAADARMTAEALRPPLPLVNDPRCPRCSLAPICLPDETNALLERTPGPPRDIIVRDPDARPLYVTTQGAVIGVSGLRVHVVAGREVIADLRLVDVSHLCVVGNVQVTTQAMAALWRRGAIIVWLSYGGWLNGWSQGPPGKNIELRRRQVIANSQGVRIAAEMIRGKIHNQRVLLRRNAKTGVPAEDLDTMKALSRSAGKAESLPVLLGFEGAAGRAYFQNFDRMVSPETGFAGEFMMNGRTRRPPLDPVNAVLSFCYALLTKDLVATLVGVGLDPYLGVLHRSRYGRPALALDLAEEFRPLISESVALQCLNNGEVQERHFDRRTVGVSLTGDGRKVVITAYERRMASRLTHPMFGYRLSYRRALDVQARILAAAIVGELDGYQALTTR